MAEQSIRDRAEMILSVDESLGSIFAELEESGRLDTTAIMLTSDNGFFFGEHGLSVERRLPYEESIRNPLLVRYPGPIGAGVRINELVSSIDIAPSVLELARARIGEQIQGRSFLPLVTRGLARKSRRTSLLIENYSDDRPFPWGLDPDYRAIRPDSHKLIHWVQHPEFDELYELTTDPHEERNVIQQPTNHGLVRRLRSDLGKLVQESISL